MSNQQNAAIDPHHGIDERVENEQTLLKAQRFIAAQREDSHSRHLVKTADTPESLFVYEEYNIVSKRARPDGAAQKSLFLTWAVLKKQH